MMKLMMPVEFALVVLMALVVFDPIASTSAFQFEGDSYIEFPFEIGYTENQVSFILTTRDQSGTIFYIGPDIGQNDFIAITLMDGHVSVAFNLGSGENVMSSLNRFNDGLPHSVMFRRQALEATLTIDDTLVASATAMPDSLTDVGGLRTSGMVFVGGVSTTYKMTAKDTNEYFLAPQLNGCIVGMLVDLVAIDSIRPFNSVNVADTCSFPICNAMASPSCMPNARPVCGIDAMSSMPAIVCECELNLFGSSCNLIGATFGSMNEGIQFALSESISSRTLLVSFDINPSLALQDTPIVLLESAISGDMVAVSLVVGRLKASYSLGGGIVADLASVPLMVNMWSRVQVFLSNDVMVVTVNEFTVLSFGAGVATTTLDIPIGTPVFVGAGFVGEMSRILINDFAPLSIYLSNNGSVTNNPITLGKGVTIMASLPSPSTISTPTPQPPIIFPSFVNASTSILNDATSPFLATFSKGTFLEVQDNGLYIEQANKISFLIQTFDDSATLAHVFGDRDYLLVRIQDGFIVASADVGGGAFGKKSAKLINDGEVHNVVVTLDLNAISLNVDGQLRRNIGRAKYTKLNSGDGPTIGVGFEGILADFVFNGVNIFTRLNFQHKTVTNYGVVLSESTNVVGTTTPLGSTTSSTTFPPLPSSDGFALLFQPTSQYSVAFNNDVYASSVRLVLTFKTAAPIGTIFRLFGDTYVDFMEVALTSGGFRVSFDLGGGVRSLDFSRNVADNEYHTISAVMKNSNVNVDVDGDIVGVVRGTLGFHVLNPGNPTKAFAGVAFSGLISQIIFQDVDLSTSAALSVGKVYLSDVLTVESSFGNP
eukprot:m.70235 g.70235  ORF g.70235 m.70235 type:complete len:824 (-) comp8302_c0_seq2:80-2551(-)